MAIPDKRQATRSGAVPRPARVVFVPGMKPKPPKRIHRQVLARCLRAGLERIDPAAARAWREGAGGLSVAAWTYLFYRRDRNIELDRQGIERVLLQPEPDAGDIADIESFARRKTRLLLRLGHAAPLFSSLFARRSMRLTVTETHRYLMNWRGIGGQVRDVVRQALTDAWSAGERVLLIAHSLGSVIAYDALWELSRGARPREGRVELFVTLGSPLASPMILRGVQGARLSGPERYPANIDRWRNFSAKGEITALHPRLGPYYGDMVAMGLLESLQDVTGFYNHFRDRGRLDVHTSYGYLVTRPVGAAIADRLRSGGAGPAESGAAATGPSGANSSAV